MKKLAILPLLLLAISAGAQGIKDGTLWYDGWNDYTATVHNDGEIMMDAMSEGQELQFKLVPIEGKKNSYTVALGPNDGAIAPFEEGHTAVYRHQEGMTVICVRDLEGGLENVLVMTPDDNLHNNIWTWIPQIKGTYTVKGEGNTVTVGDETFSVDGEKGSFEVVTFNDMVNWVVKVPGTSLEGYWEVVPTLEGYDVFGVTPDEYGLFNRSGGYFSLVESDPYVGRFDFASRMILPASCITRYRKATLRVMRNEILARHGYRFQSKDLQDYFGSQDWYMPGDNSKVKLSFVEQLNVELLKRAEADPDHDDYAREQAAPAP